MVSDRAKDQQETVAEAIQHGVNWFDTAATYADGRSEQVLGAALSVHSESHGADSRPHIATKVRLAADDLDDVESAVFTSFKASLRRLGVKRVALLQLHNSVTANRGDLPTSITANDVLGRNGVATAFEALKNDGRVEALGFTGLGDRSSLQEVVSSDIFSAAQVPLNLLTPCSSDDRSAGSVDVDYLQFAEQCADHGVGVIAIRVMAGGALVGQPPAPHTYKTKFFPLDLFHRDAQRAAKVDEAIRSDLTLAEASVRYVLGVPGVTTALVGFASAEQVRQCLSFAQKGPLDRETQRTITRAGSS